MSNAAYMRNYMKIRRAQKRAQAIEMLGSRCVRCGSTDSLEFDHIDPATKSYGISAWSFDHAWEYVLQELGKCQLLCSPCHVEKSKIDYATWNASNGRTCACGREFASFQAYRGHRAYCKQ